eukprot:SAG11_NODE_200_length_12606_cov_51.874550_2_plen_82_part_00
MLTHTRALYALLVALASVSNVFAWYKDVPARERGSAPYPYPATNKDGTAPVYAVVPPTSANRRCRPRLLVSFFLLPHNPLP